MPGRPTPRARATLQEVSKGHGEYTKEHKKTVRFYIDHGKKKGTHFATIYGQGQELSYEKVLQAANKYVEVMRLIGVILRHDGYEGK